CTYLILNNTIMIHKLSELVEKAANRSLRKIAVAAAEDVTVLKSLKAAIKEGVVIPILVGDKLEIERIAKSIGFNLNGIQIVHNDKGATVSAQLAVSMVKNGDADILMKGFVSTGALLKAVLNKENGLRKSQ